MDAEALDAAAAHLVAMAEQLRARGRELRGLAAERREGGDALLKPRGGA